ncbi:bifunctional phosphopantothenoylcysteine decarboxylase/phosphopantothenate--cysteine ligase CoaBC [Sporanaerobacter sp.]|uniref:bifunctional phosphopantothenoylcysteine decarboxylase/phosphopantothenate--cysteine ligase CoaBC n=1 Tax=Sporanaerobacter sp. TaxID=2010183 RepID=UPI003A1038FB
MLEGKNILVCVSGGIAAYKVVDVVSRLKKLNANVNVIMTKSATNFVAPLTFQTLSQNFVNVDMFEEPKTWEVEHISLAEKADLVLIAPATANVIGKIANGIADDMLTTVVMATKAKVIFAPSMNTHMYMNPIVKENMEKLKAYGYEFINANVGLLACGTYGEGRMAEPAEIVEYLKNSFYDKDLKGKKIVITAGPTIEPLDPVRYMTNFSSGKMGYALAKMAKNRGGDVVLITGPTNLCPPSGVKVVNINTTREMLNAIEKEFDDCHVLIKAAAPLDYRPEIVSDKKIKKGEEALELRFVRNPDIAMHFGKIKGEKIMVGFAAETNNLIEYAKEKMAKKNFDFIVANDVSKEGAGFRTNTNIVNIIDKSGKVFEYPLMSKDELANIILDKVVELLN